MLEYDRIDVSEEDDVNRTNGLRKCIICLYWYFHEIDFRFQPKVCDDCFNEKHDYYHSKLFLLMKAKAHLKI